ncbi:hypothetical protein GALL_428850 [mine drainage metagenome]|uniref:Uncharacterized protein n=1 Tax=mine drainage metagenome TaxID=410659 RepID=A0A1J5Q624_9ZZZZ
MRSSSACGGCSGRRARVRVPATWWWSAVSRPSVDTPAWGPLRAREGPTASRLVTCPVTHAWCTRTGGRRRWQLTSLRRARRRTGTSTWTSRSSPSCRTRWCTAGSRWSAGSTSGCGRPTTGWWDAVRSRVSWCTSSSGTSRGVSGRPGSGWSTSGRAPRRSSRTSTCSSTRPRCSSSPAGDRAACTSRSTATGGSSRRERCASRCSPRTSGPRTRRCSPWSSCPPM